MDWIRLRTKPTLQTKAMFSPEDNSYERDDHHTVEKEDCKHDDGEDIKGGAFLRTQARRCSAAFNALTAQKFLQNSERDCHYNSLKHGKTIRFFAPRRHVLAFHT